MSLAWSRLEPLRPALDGADWDQYAEPPHHTGAKLAKRLTLQNERIALWGPAGSGKSTELRAAARFLQPSALSVVIALDVELDLRQGPQEWELHRVIGWAIVTAASDAGLVLSPPLATRLQQAGVIRHQGARSPALASRDLTRELLVELGRRQPIVLLVDGLEKPTPAIARETLRQLGHPAPGVGVLVVLSPAQVTGPEAYEVLEDLGFRETALRPVVVDPTFGDTATEGRKFLKTIALRRLGASLDDALEALMDAAAVASGGVPRTFLQLLRDAHTAAALAGRKVPKDGDLAEAVGDHRSTLRRLLRDGDLEALEKGRGTSGIEVPVERRTRLLAHGLMLEYDLPGASDPVVFPHPLLEMGG